MRAHILYVLHAYKVFPPDVTGGIPEAIAYIAQGMSSRHQSLILVPRDRGWGRRFTLDGMSVEAVTSFGTAMSSPLAPSFPLRLAQRARKASLVALHHPFPLNDIGVAIGFPEHTALVVHWHTKIVGKRPFAAALAPILTHTLARAERIIVSHPALIKNSPFLVRYADKCMVIPYGVHVDYWGELNDTQRRKAAELRARYPRLVLATGRLVPYKGFQVLIEALRHVDATVMIVGEGPLEDDLRQTARRLGVGERFVLAGGLSRDDLKVHLQVARMFALPSVTEAEAFGIVQLEAMAAGLPVINTDLPTGVPDVARNEREGLTVPPGDPAALAAGINRLLDDEGLARNLGAAGRSRVAVEYRAEVFVKRIEDVYEAAIAERRNAVGVNSLQRVGHELS
jgi:glycosyltransferase involved in cell wall biosynthesis